MCKSFYSILFFALFFSACKSRKSTISSLAKEHSGNKTSTVALKKLKQKYAVLLQVNEADIKNQKLYAFIDEWYATPYKYGGKDKLGIDCSGLINKLTEEVYSKKTAVTTKALLNESIKINKYELREGDFVFFNIESTKVSHVGLYLQNNKFLHSSSKKGVMISDLNEPYFKKYFLSAAKLK